MGHQRQMSILKRLDYSMIVAQGLGCHCEDYSEMETCLMPINQVVREPNGLYLNIIYKNM